MLINGEVITTSGFCGSHFGCPKRPIGVGMVEKMIRTWNEVEMLINGEIITTSGFSEVILEVLKGSIELVIVKNLFKIWNEVEMSIMCEVITTSGFYGSQFRGPNRSHWTDYSEKLV